MFLKASTTLLLLALSALAHPIDDNNLSNNLNSEYDGYLVKLKDDIEGMSIVKDLS